LLPVRSQEKKGDGGPKDGTKKPASEPARQEVELLEVQLEVHKALVDEAAIRLKVAKERLARLQKAGDAVTESALLELRGQVEILEAQLRVKQAESRVAEVRLKHARHRGIGMHDHGKSGHDHGDWWCQEHGVPEHICSLCIGPEEVRKLFKDKGDWCPLHERAKSQCFKCEPGLYKKYEAMFEAKYGKKPPRPPEQEFRK
jgi:hypothetical protein